jgi:hypothetical protein
LAELPAKFTVEASMRNFDPTLMILIPLLVAVTQSASAQEPLAPARAEIPPVIDGELNDPIWEAAPSVSGFKTWQPDFGQDLPGNTVVFLAYDSANLYFAFRCTDNEPDQIKTSVTSRDNINNDDWVSINLDSFNDRQSLYAFYINPSGIQMDARTAAGGVEDYSIDMVWYSEGRIDEQGYSVEVQIPFKSIRFTAGEPVTMRVLFERSVSRTSERGTFPALDPQALSFATQTRALLVRNIKRYNLFELLPAITFSRNSSQYRGRLMSEGDQTEVSLTAKLGLTSDLVIDGTYNPDFSQVEADAGQVDFNLRYALYYEEKRPFFLEGKEHFAFAGAYMASPLRNIVHTRTIRNPLLGFKLTGKLGEKNTLASLYALDELSVDSLRRKYAQVGILRYKRALGGDGFYGGFATARKLDDSNNITAGTDGRIRISDPSWIGYHGIVSRSQDQQQSSEINGHALGLDVQYDTRTWFCYLRCNDLSEEFETEVGYVTRTGITQFQLNTYRMFYPRSRIFLRIWPMFVTRFTHDKPSGGWEYFNAIVVSTTLPRSSRIRLGFVDSDEIYLGQKFNTSYFRSELFSQLTGQLYGYVDYHHRYEVRYVENPYQGYGHWVKANLVYQPVNKFLSSLSLTYNDFYRYDSGEKEFDYTIARFKNAYQLNRYLLLRVIGEYNSFREELMTDFLASFTYVPGTVIHIGYGSLYARTRWGGDQYVYSDRFDEIQRGLFFKASYLWRM